MEIFIYFFIVILVVVVKGMKNFNANAPKRGPVIGTPGQHPQNRQEPNPFQEMADSMQQEWDRMTEPQQEKTERPVLRRNPYAERSDYGTSPLDRQQPPEQKPLSTMLDQAFLTGEDLTPQTRELPLQIPLTEPPADNQDLMAQSFARAFPAAQKIAKATRPGIHRPIRLNARGRKNIRNAVLMSEVIARPRAFDL